MAFAGCTFTKRGCLTNGGKLQVARGKGVLKTLACVSTSPFVKLWLKRSTAVSVLHSFDQACNLINQHGEIVSLVTPQLGNGPFAFVVDMVSFSDWVHVQTAVSTTSSSIILGNLHFDLTNVTIWNPHPNWATLQSETACPRNGVGAVWLPKVNAIKKMVAQHLPKLDGMMSILQEQLHQAQQQFVYAIQSCLYPVEGGHAGASLQETVSALAGLGNGLTPAGDDFLMGALYGLWATQPQAVVQKWGEVIMETAVSHTTTLSAAWLRAAAKGEATEPWHELCGQLMMEGDGWETAVKHILATGHSSGADALAGFTAILSLSPVI